MRPLLRMELILAPALAFSAAPLAQVSTPPPAYRMIVHPNNPVTTLDRRVLEDIFLRKVKSWPSGETARPIDLQPSSPVRRRFSEEVLRRPLSAVRAYWQQRIFSGQALPPPEVAGDADVIKHTMKYPGAIGYVSGTATLNGPKEVRTR